jgi:hypothetical protein
VVNWYEATDQQEEGRKTAGQTGLALMRNESEENVLSNYVEGLAASGTEAEHGEVIVE